MYKKLTAIAALALGIMSAKAQIIVGFNTKDTGKKLPIEWGMDAAWDWDYNVMRGIAHYGTAFTTGRISFQPYNLVDASKINDASANFGLSAGQVRKLQWRIDLIKRTGTTKVNINCDHEVLVRKMDDEGNYSDALGNDYVGKENYVSTNGSSYKTTEWVNLIKATVKYAQAQGLEVISVSPFNESDYGWEQYYNGQGGTSTTNQDRYGIPTFKAIAQAIKADSFFDGIRVCGGNTLNCDRASAWYEGLKPYVDEGNTHQLAGSFDNYANFFAKVRQDGNVATADEVHNVGEAMVGVEYGMQNAIWWGFDSKARGQFMHDSNEGARIGYAEDRTHWTSAAVYRNDKDGEIHGFIGSSERQANVSTYKFQCGDRDVYFNGYGPQREWLVTTVGGANGSYQNGQINFEYLFDITYGEDVQSQPIDGNYQIMSAVDMKLVTSNGAWSGNNYISATAQANSDTQRWHIYPGRSDGDCSYWFIDNVGDAAQHWNLLNGGGAGALSAGSRVICYNAGHDALEQWYIRYAKNGYFYIMARQSNKYLYNNNGTLSLQDAPTSSTRASELKKYMWRLMPTDAIAETTAPAVPTGLAAAEISSGVSISWDAVSESNVTYNVLRQDADGWNTIARCQSTPSFTDTKTESGKGYNYKVQTVDYSGNRSELSKPIQIITAGGGEPLGDYTAGTWEWTGESPSASNYYIYNKANDRFLKATSVVTATPSEATLFTFSAATSCTISYQDNGIKYVYENTGNQSWGTTNTNTWTIQSQTGGYYVYHRDPGYRYGTRNRYIEMSSTGLSYPYQNFNNNNRLLQFISSDQMTKYGMVSEYTDAYNKAASYTSSNLSTDLKTELNTTLEACDGSINYQNIEGYITTLNAISANCYKYLQENPTEPSDDFTGLIVNPTIIQDGTTNDAPKGWIGASTNVTGNGHYTEGTGNTRLEAWHWTADLNADYYQDIIVPNGLYILSATTHQREDGNAALYSETYRSLETTMPVGDGNEAETVVENILVTDGVIRIGAKVSGSGNWMTADDFTLTRVSSSEETALSHYTDAIDYLNGEAAKELARNTDHTELLASKNAANSCEANVSAYEVAINAYYAAIEKAKKLPELPEVVIGEDLSGNLSTSWIGQTGTYWNREAPERYEGDNTPIPEGRAMYQVVTDLVPGVTYEIQFYAVANVARVLGPEYYGSGIAYLFANDTHQDIDVVSQEGCDPMNYLRTLTAVADENGEIAYGIANKKAGGQWYVAKEKSLVCLGISHTANLKVNAGKYGTFVAPFDVELPEGILAYVASNVNNSSVVLTAISGNGKLLPANTPVLLENKSNETITKEYDGYYSGINTTITQDDNLLIGHLIGGVDIPLDSYILQIQDGRLAFYRVANTRVGTANRCYLVKPSSANANTRLDIVFDFESTGIEDVEDVEAEEIEGFYSIDGTKIAAPQKGINIVRMKNGGTRKVFVK